MRPMRNSPLCRLKNRPSAPSSFFGMVTLIIMAMFKEGYDEQENERNTHDRGIDKGKIVRERHLLRCEHAIEEAPAPAIPEEFPISQEVPARFESYCLRVRRNGVRGERSQEPDSGRG